MYPLAAASVHPPPKRVQKIKEAVLSCGKRWESGLRVAAERMAAHMGCQSRPYPLCELRCRRADCYIDEQTLS